MPILSKFIHNRICINEYLTVAALILNIIEE